MPRDDAKRYYTDYCNHMWRFFILNRDNPAVRLDAECDARAYKCCQRIFGEFSREEQRILCQVYGADVRRMPMRAIVADVAYRKPCLEDDVWKLLNRANRSVAKLRGLIP